MKEACAKIQEKDFTLWFKILYLILTLFTFNSFTAHSKVLFYFTIVVAGFGALILMWRIFHFKEFQNTYALPILLIFAVSYFISMLFNYQYGVLSNIKALLWMALQIGILFALDARKSVNNIKKEFIILITIFQFYILIANCISLWYLVVHKGYASFQSPTKNMLGFVWGRLWGIYTDPNYASVGCCVSIFLSLYLVLHKYGRAVKLLNYLQIILSFLYIVFSDSRTGFVCLIIGVLIFSMFFLNKYFRKGGKKRVTRQIASLSLSVLISIGSILLLYGVKNIYNSIERSQISSQLPQISNSESENELLGREQDLKDDISNRRFSIWKSGLEIWEKSPAVGTSFRNIVAFAKSKTPSTYLVKNDMGAFESFHNVLIDILVSQGVLGAIIAFIFIYKILKLILKNRKKYEGQNGDFLFLLTSIVLIFCVSGLFLSDIVYINSSATFLTWCLAGYLVHLLSSSVNTSVKQNGEN